MAPRPSRSILRLAVLNFALATLGGVSTASLARLLDAPGSGADGAGRGPVYAALAAGLVCSALLVISGVGYLKRHPFWGRTTANAYALLAFATSVFVLAVLPQGFGAATVIGLCYPPLTLALVNFRFRAQLT